MYEGEGEGRSARLGESSVRLWGDLGGMLKFSLG